MASAAAAPSCAAPKPQLGLLEQLTPAERRFVIQQRLGQLLNQWMHTASKAWANAAIFAVHPLPHLECRFSFLRTLHGLAPWWCMQMAAK